MLAFVCVVGQACFEFLFDVPNKTRVVLSYSACRNVCFVCVSAYCVEVLYCQVTVIAYSLQR